VSDKQGNIEKALAKAESGQLTVRPVKASVMSPMQLAEVFMKSGFFTDTQDIHKATVKILYGQELGISPMASMTGISIVKGKPFVGYQIIGTLIDRHPRYDYKVITRNDQKCEIQFFKDGEASGPPMCYTLEDAKRGGTQNLDRYPATMLFARCLSQGARTYCPDVFGGCPVYVEGEIPPDMPKDDKPERGVASILGRARQSVQEEKPEEVQDADFQDESQQGLDI